MKNEPYSEEKIIAYHTALSVADNLEKEGFISAEDKSRIYKIIAEKYNIKENSIFAV